MANRWEDSGLRLLKDDPKNPGLDWSERMFVAVDVINKINPNYLYDFGCGESLIKNYINKNIIYTGFDSIEHCDKIKIIDLNMEYPKIENDGLGLCLGIFEYIDDVERFVFFLNKNFKNFIFSCRNNDIEKYLNIINIYFKTKKIKNTIKNPPNQSVFLCEKI